MAIRRADALITEARQAQIEQERQSRIAQHKQAVAQRGLAQRTLAARGGRGPLNIFAEGDSWFDYPLSNDTINWIKADGTPWPEILNLAHYGDATTQMLGVAKRERIIENLQDPANGAFDALLFSGGGNDIAGDQFCLWIVPFVAGTDPTNGVDSQRLANMLGVVQAAYVDLIKIRDSIIPDCVIFIHAYDFAQPSGQGVCGLGPWLKPSLDLRGWTDFPAAAQVVKDVLQAFDKLVAQLEQQHKNVVYVRTQGTLSPATDWANELHPTEQGFEKIAAVFLQALRKKFPNRI
jgi:hypothetical protein